MQKQQSKSSKFDLRSNVARNSAEKCTMYIASGISCKRFFLVVFAVFCACIHLKLRMLISNSNFPINLSCPFCKEPSSSARCTDPSHVLFFEVTTQSNVLYYMTYERIDFSYFFRKNERKHAYIKLKSVIAFCEHIFIFIFILFLVIFSIFQRNNFLIVNIAKSIE